MNFDSSMSAARSRFAQAGHTISQASGEAGLATGKQVTPDQLVEAIGQLLEVLERNPVDAPTPAMQENGEAEKVANHALAFLEDLGVYADRLELGEASQELQRVATAVALWLAAWGAPIHAVEMAVNALGELANETSDGAELARILGMMDALVAHAGPEIRADLETANPYRAWRILLLNRAIVAVRAQDLDGIRRAFDEVAQRLPDDAGAFFREALTQVKEKGGYRPEVLELVRGYAGEGLH